MLSRTEKLCKYSLLALLIFSIIASLRTMIRHDLIYAIYDIDAILFFVLLLTAIQGIVGIIGWIMIAAENEHGKNVISKTYGVSFGIYGLSFLFLLIMLVFPKHFVFYPFAFITVLLLFLLSGAVLLLQHIWTRYIY